MSGTSTFIATTFCFSLGHLTPAMFCEVESNVKMMRCRLQGGNGKVETGGQGEATWVDETGGEGKAAAMEEAQGEAVKMEAAVDG